MESQVCVCGAGTMGSGIAQIFAQKGWSVKIFDIQKANLDKAKNTIEKNLQYLLGKGKINQQQKSDISSRINFEDDVKRCTDPLIIEAIYENQEAKINLLRQLAEVNDEKVILASNTSSISISQIQKEISYPQRVVGMHFFNPAYIMPLVEIVRGENTSDETIESAKSVCKKIDKHPIVCKDSPGFIVNRVARPYYLEAMRLLENKAATVAEIDEILEATGFKMGPFRLMDFIGMDINLATTKSVYNQLGRPERLEPAITQIKLVEEGNLGKKTGKGFYNYGPTTR